MLLCAAALRLRSSASFALLRRPARLQRWPLLWPASQQQLARAQLCPVQQASDSPMSWTTRARSPEPQVIPAGCVAPLRNGAPAGPRLACRGWSAHQQRRPPPAPGRARGKSSSTAGACRARDGGCHVPHGIQKMNTEYRITPGGWGAPVGTGLRLVVWLPLQTFCILYSVFCIPHGTTGQTTLIEICTKMNWVLICYW